MPDKRQLTTDYDNYDQLKQHLGSTWHEKAMTSSKGHQSGKREREDDDDERPHK